MRRPEGYPAVWIRVHKRFGPRQMEWFMAAIATAWGAVMLLPAETMSGDAWIIFRTVLDERAWGFIMFFLGAARLVGLFINGARPLVTPTIRVVSAGVGFMVWVGISTGFAMAGVIDPWLAIYPIFAVAEIVNFVRAMGDVGNGKSIP